MVPPTVLLVNTAPYLTFIPGSETAQAACLAIMNSIPFDWQARKFVEIHLNFFVLEGLAVPNLGADDFHAVANAAAKLSSPDPRFADFSKAFNLQPRELEPNERESLRADIDARVARAWGLGAEDLELMFQDFTMDALPPEYRHLVIRRLAEI